MQMSHELDKLIPALICFQGAITNPSRDVENTFFHSKYTPLDSMIDHVRPLLVKFGLGVTQHVEGMSLTTVVIHESGQYMMSSQEMLIDKQNMQGQGSAITYARRYALAAVLGIASDTDDDGNAASKTKSAPSADPFDPFDL